ncbi:hypothetical protein EV213_1129 [Aureibacillus halotolerans]|uniref:O-antigen ligase-like membrane protein n=1 Tax=Aureibacillus halotolerans TaxID=1508390 RepID=A0A4R6U001_9BACI|nr:hypothetical protein EV213_1129 [Aureibacillus halotolerans]
MGILTFLFIFDLSLLGLPSIFSSRKIVFVILFIHYIVSFKRFRFNTGSMYFILSINVMIFLWLFILSVSWPQSPLADYVYSREMYFIIYTIIGSVLLANFFKGLDEYARSVVIAMVIQSLIVFSQFSFEGFRVFLENTFQPTGNIEYTRTDRANGVGAEGAFLSLLLATGLYFCSYFLHFKRIITVNYVIFFLCLLTATFLTGRTGFYIGCVLSIFVFSSILLKDYGKTAMLKVLPIMLIAFFSLSFLVDRLGINEDRLEQLNTWVTSVVDDGLEEGSVTALMEMQIPSLSNETVVGTAVYRGTTSNGTTVQHDSGYVQMYSSLGVVFAVIFYVSLFIYLITLIRKVRGGKLKVFFFAYILLIFIVELKEPFIFKYIPVGLIITAILLSGIKSTSKDHKPQFLKKENANGSPSN